MRPVARLVIEQATARARPAVSWSRCCRTLGVVSAHGPGTDRREIRMPCSIRNMLGGRGEPAVALVARVNRWEQRHAASAGHLLDGSGAQELSDRTAEGLSSVQEMNEKRHG